MRVSPYETKLTRQLRQGIPFNKASVDMTRHGGPGTRSKNPQRYDANKPRRTERCA